MLGGVGGVAAVEAELTRLHAAAVARFRARYPDVPVELIGFHGHTILHRPAERRTWQIGDGALLARLAGVDVVADFRSADVAAGGEGAPLAPLYHAALAADLAKPLAVLNLGGVGNVTWIGDGPDEILAFDTGPGNALIDDWVRRHTGADGRFRRRAGPRRPGLGGACHAFLAHPYFARPPPKSLDRDDFRDAPPTGCRVADGAATLTEMTAASVARGPPFPGPPREWLVCGGGRHNPAMMAALARRLSGCRCGRSRRSAGTATRSRRRPSPIWRSLGAGLPLSLPSTTGAPHPVCGGRLFPAAALSVLGSEPRQVGERQPPAMDMQPAQLGAAMQLGNTLPGLSSPSGSKAHLRRC